MKRTASMAIAALACVIVSGQAAEANDARLRGVWKTLVYVVGGEEHPMNGLFIFTARHFAANAFFRMSGGAQDDSNANAGTYRTEGDRIVFTQQVQIHVRPGDEEQPIVYGKDVVEEARYEIEGDRLTVFFPSGNKYLCQRIVE